MQPFVIFAIIAGFWRFLLIATPNIRCYFDVLKLFLRCYLWAGVSSQIDWLWCCWIFHKFLEFARRFHCRSKCVQGGACFTFNFTSYSPFTLYRTSPSPHIELELTSCSPSNYFPQISVATLFGNENLNALRSLRALRPLRAVSKFEGMKVSLVDEWN